MGRVRGVEKEEEAAGDSDSVVVPMEDTVQTLIDHLVYPLLPSKASFHDSPTLSKQKSVAMQMHAVVLLYNYYHRKQFPGLEFLGFDSFCKVAVNARPSLLAYMKFMQRCNDEAGELDTQLSITEEMVMSACNICRELDASRDAPSVEKWPVFKVAVFVVDSTKMNCLLQFSSKTQGVWSLIEKDIDMHHYNMEALSETKNTNSKKRSAASASRNELAASEAALRQLAFSAVKEETGILQTDLTVLESHTAYSLSKEKSTSRFYLMQCMKAINEEVIQVPIKEAIGSLRGPLVSKILDSYEVTSAVEYFHLLPYAGIISDWFSRETSGINSQLLPERQGNIVGNCSPEADKPCAEEGGETGDGFHWSRQIPEAPDNETRRSKNVTVSEQENGDCCMSASSEAVCSPQFMADDSPLDHSGRLFTCHDAINSVLKTISDTDVKKRNKSLTQRALKATENGVKDQAEMIDSAKKPCSADKTGVKHRTKNDDFLFHDRTSGNAPVVPLPTGSENLDKVKVVLASKGNDLLQSALQALQSKRDELCHQHRQLEDEIAVCEKNIQTIIGRGEDDLMLKIESIIDACNAACCKGAGRKQTGESLSQHCKRKRLSEAVLILRNPCQELDEICTENNWILPRYSVLPSDGGFLANVTVQGLDFEISGRGDLHSDPREARESAASQMLSKLRSMAKQLQ
ncbi:hypothetical protein MRB53_035205 [Persea americana]|uniref:Uncharacterized protein n=1 Tax=Persea americana TaxID=3435 RepID=A0ACC2K3Z1_PERAE|nr:hypothetical protein MRB53_035205 [Persea americana]